MRPPLIKFRLSSSQWLILGLTLLAFCARMWHLSSVPVGWRDDELINAFTISQRALDGDWRVFYPQASGHEALYHWMVGGGMVLIGRTTLGLRFVSVIMGTMTVPLLYRLGRDLFSTRIGLTAAAALTFSFWSLMYSRFALRHIATPVFMLAAFIALWNGIQQPKKGMRPFIWAGIWSGIGLYVYFAARGVPLIIAGFGFLLWLGAGEDRKRLGRGLSLTLLISAILAIPLILTLRQLPQGSARIAELAGPITAARAGDYSVIADYARATFSMFHSDGDPEHLYNIPHRPVFSPAGALLFWLGILWSIVQLFQHMRPKQNWRPAMPYLFLLLWWLAGLVPGMVSVPPASLGHTILAQPVTYLFPVLVLDVLGQRLGRKKYLQQLAPVLLLLFPVLIARRDLQDYFVTWPQMGQVRFLYRADLDDVANYLADNPATTDFGITGLLEGPWDRVALTLENKNDAIQPRWFNPQRALMVTPSSSFSGFPKVDSPFAASFTAVPDGQAGGYQFSTVTWEPSGENLLTDEICFENGLCAVSAEFSPPNLDLMWRVEHALTLPPIPLVSFPPPPGTYVGPRLAVFTHLRDVDGNLLANNDGLWVDPQTLRAGDRFLQRHLLPVAENTAPASIALGLYDPFSAERILTTSGADHVQFPLP